MGKKQLRLLRPSQRGQGNIAFWAGKTLLSACNAQNLHLHIHAPYYTAMIHTLLADHAVLEAKQGKGTSRESSVHLFLLASPMK
jgi:hypothetical protein